MKTTDNAPAIPDEVKDLFLPSSISAFLHADKKCGVFLAPDIEAGEESDEAGAPEVAYFYELAETFIPLVSARFLLSKEIHCPKLRHGAYKVPMVGIDDEFIRKRFDKYVQWANVLFSRDDIVAAMRNCENAKINDMGNVEELKQVYKDLTSIKAGTNFERFEYNPHEAAARIKRYLDMNPGFDNYDYCLNGLHEVYKKKCIAEVGIELPID